MSKYQIPHHNLIDAALQQFNTDFLEANSIFFGGGTRILLEIDEYRESVDIDFLCPNKDSYRAVRETISNASLGHLVKQDFEYLREIRADRYGVRTFIKISDTVIKLEIVSYDEYQLTGGSDKNLFPVPYLSRESCFMTKLLANADRLLSPPFKDSFDLVAMHLAWGDIPEIAWREAERQYGSVPKTALIKALDDILTRPHLYYEKAPTMKMKAEWMNLIITKGAAKLKAEQV